MIWLISTALVLVLLGAYARAVAATPPDVPEPMEFEEPHRDDRWGGDW